MKLSDLKCVRQPERVEPKHKVCVACTAFKAECYVPVGESLVQMCWLCAHAVVEHDCPLHEAMTHECDCKPEDIYPGRPSHRPS